MEDHYPLYPILPKPLKIDLQNKIKVFLNEKRFFGCDELEVTDKMRVLIAAQACTLIINRPSTYFPKLKCINLYPQSYFAHRPVEIGSGVVQHQEQLIQGESWNSGELVLAWGASRHGAINMYDGHNVVMHEFAHQLDQEDGRSDGAPLLSSRDQYRSWSRILGEEYDLLIKKRKKMRKTVLNKYGATHPAEFFAVASEAFFEKPGQLQKRHPELYEELRRYYQVDPASWFKSDS